MLEIRADVRDVAGKCPKDGSHSGLLERGGHRLVEFKHPHRRELLSKPVGAAIESGTEDHELLEAVLELLAEHAIDVLDARQFVVVGPGAHALSCPPREWPQRRHLHQRGQARPKRDEPARQVIRIAYPFVADRCARRPKAGESLGRIPGGPRSRSLF